MGWLIHGVYISHHAMNIWGAIHVGWILCMLMQSVRLHILGTDIQLGMSGCIITVATIDNVNTHVIKCVCVCFFFFFMYIYIYIYIFMCLVFIYFMSLICNLLMFIV